MTGFSKQINGFADKYRSRMKRTMTRAGMAVVNDAQTTKASGGRMPVDTGFLRRSVVGAVNTIPRDGSGSPLAAFSSANLGDSVAVGWYADYARIQEMRNAFVGLAVVRWQERVSAAAAIEATR